MFVVVATQATSNVDKISETKIRVASVLLRMLADRRTEIALYSWHGGYTKHHQAT